MKNQATEFEDMQKDISHHWISLMGDSILAFASRLNELSKFLEDK
jgi:hypothetical protein